MPTCFLCDSLAALVAVVGAYQLPTCEEHADDAFASARRYGSDVRLVWIRARLSFGARAE